MARLLLIVGGGIAAYKASELIRLARRAGSGVQSLCWRMQFWVAALTIPLRSVCCAV